MSRYIDEISARENFQDVLAYMGSEVKRMLKNVPTADVVEVRHGMWMHEDEYDDEYICSICGQLAPLSISQIHEHTTKYCPWCGAKMNGGRSENGK